MIIDTFRLTIFPHVSSASRSSRVELGVFYEKDFVRNIDRDFTVKIRIQELLLTLFICIPSEAIRALIFFMEGESLLIMASVLLLISSCTRLL